MQQQTNSDTIIDDRTGVAFGAVPEEEVREELARTQGISAASGASEQEVAYIKKNMMNNVDLENPVNAVLSDTINVFKAGAHGSYVSSDSLQRWADYAETGDKNFLDEAVTRREESNKILEPIPEELKGNAYYDWVGKPIIDAFGQMAYQLRQAPSRVVDSFSEEFSNPPLNRNSMAEGMLVSATKAKFGYSIDQSKGEIMESLTMAEIPFDVASSTAKLFGPLAGSLDSLGDITSIIGGGASSIAKKGLLEFITGQLTEGGTEAVQEGINNIALIYAMNVQAEREGKPLAKYTLDKISQNMAKAGVGGLAAGTALTGASATATKSATTFSSEAIENVRKYAENKRIKREAAAIKTRREQDIATMEKTSIDPVVPLATANSENISQPSAAEIDARSADEGVVGTKITDADIDETITAEDEGAAADALLAEVDDSMGTKTEAYDSMLRKVLPDQAKADAVMALIDARAEALGLTTEEFFEATGLVLEQDLESDMGKTTKGMVTFLEGAGDVKAIVTAFKSADISTMIHEVAHVFRKDIVKEDLAVLESWAGVVDGVWTDNAEEKFARAFERYVTDGIAPNKALEGTFQKLQRWMMNIYKVLDNSSLDIDITPEVKTVFDSLLVNEKNTRQEISKSNDVARTLNQNREEAELQAELQAELDKVDKLKLNKRQKNKKKKAILKGTQRDTDLAATKEQYIDRVKERYENFNTEQERDRFEVLQGIRELKTMWGKGKTEGKNLAKQHLKAVLTRRKNRKMNTQRNARLKRDIFKQLNTFVPKKRARKSRLDKYNTALLKEIKNAFTEVRSVKNAKEYLQKLNSGDIDVEQTDSVQLMKTRFARAVVDNNRASSRKFADIGNGIRDIITVGKTESPFFKNAYEVRNLVDISADSIVGHGADIDKIVSLVGKSAKAAHEMAMRHRSIAKIIKQWKFGHEFLFGNGGIVNLIAGYHPDEAGTSPLYKALDYYENEDQQKTEEREDLDRINEGFDKAFGVEGGARKRSFTRNQLQHEHQAPIHDIGIGFPISADNIRTIYAWMQTGRFPARLEFLGYDAEVQAKVNEFMDTNAGHKEFVQALFDYYNDEEVYQRTNAVHENEYGIPLNREPMYYPVQGEAIVSQERLEKAEKPQSQLKHDQWARRVPDSASALKAKTNTTEAGMYLTSDLVTFQKYSTEMAHFRNFAKKSRLAKGVARDKLFRALVTYEHGPALLKTFSDQTDNIAADGGKQGMRIAWLDKIRSNMIVNSIALSVGTMLKQGISVVNFWENMPLDQYIKNVANLPQLAKDMEKVRNSSLIKNRIVDRDLKDSKLDKAYHKFYVNPTITNSLTLNVKLGDSGAIMFGAAAYMRYLIDKKNMSPKDALLEASRKANNIQQSGFLSEQSLFQQNAGTISRFITPYSSGPRQAMQHCMEGWRDVMNATTPAQRLKGIKKIAINWIIVPALFSLAQSAIDPDDNDTTREMLYSIGWGPMGMLYAGPRTAYNAFRRVAGLQSYNNSSMLANELNEVLTVADKMVSGDMNEITFDDAMSAIQGVTIGITPVPLKRAGRMVENAVDGNLMGATFGTKVEK